MRICPFVSHMLGDDNSDSWTIDGGNITKENKPQGNIVILGYEDGDAGTQTDTMTEVATETVEETIVPSHLHCLKEACRFYKEKTGDCQFDLVFSMLDNRQDSSPEHDPKEIAHEVELHHRHPRLRSQAVAGGRRAAQQHGRGRVQTRRTRFDLPQVHIGGVRVEAR